MSIPDILHVRINILENEIFEGAFQLLKHLRPSWNRERITFRVFTDGLTNKLIACVLDNKMTVENVVVIRIYGNKTDLLIDRTAELRNMRILFHNGYAPRLIASFENGLAMEFVIGVTLTPESVLDPKVWKLVARTLAKMHKVDISSPEIKKEPMLWRRIEQFLNLLPETFSKPAMHSRFVTHFGSVASLRHEYETLKSALSSTSSEVVFCHNDLLLGNIIYNEDMDKVTLIDYEYAGYNYQAFDIANHFLEFVGMTDMDYSRMPSREFQLEWLGVYLSEYTGLETPCPAHAQLLHRQVAQFMLTSHVMWGVWSLVQAELSNIEFDYFDFAVARFSEYFRVKDATLSLPSL